MSLNKVRVTVAQEAKQDPSSVRRMFARDSPFAARRWLQSIRKTINSLGHQPLRFEVIPEAADHEFRGEYRHAIFGNYRVIYRVDETSVIVVRVIHAARLVRPSSLPDE